MKVGTSVLFVVSMTIVSSCSKPEAASHTPDSASLSLNNRASVYIGNAAHSPDSLRILYYDSAIELLDIAILRDSLDVAAYTNKADVLKRKGLLFESFAVLEQALTINPNLAEVAMMQGFIMEKKGRMDLARKKYRHAMDLFEENADKDPENVKAKAAVVFAVFFLNEKKGKEKLDELIKKYPESRGVNEVADIIRDVGRKKYIEEVTKASVKVLEVPVRYERTLIGRNVLTNHEASI